MVASQEEPFIFKACNVKARSWKIISYGYEIAMGLIIPKSLPPAAQRWLEHVLPADIESPSRIRISQTGEMDIRDKWTSFTAERNYQADPLSFNWKARLAMLQGIWIVAEDGHAGARPYDVPGGYAQARWHYQFSDHGLFGRVRIPAKVVETYERDDGHWEYFRCQIKAVKRESDLT
jgi:hypothetical protein